ncbi:hypothetical protein N1851_002280 [Merluccius polli]|uniref:Uncharacterized protein n=1 Tax=Merluccius polli TaxID=89951 RepID=A0AA47P8U3_MERPO|nr:hypothetical protein N1851_002280 [Merluccius polli]
MLQPSSHLIPSFVKFRIEFKILLLTYKALHDQAPSYLKELIVPYYPTRTLRPLNAGLLVVPIVSKSKTGARAFSYQAPLQWNQLPVVVREADTLSTFKSRLKTFLFDKAYRYEDILSNVRFLGTGEQTELVMITTSALVLKSSRQLCLSYDDNSVKRHKPQESTYFRNGHFASTHNHVKTSQILTESELLSRVVQMYDISRHDGVLGQWR